MNFGYPFTPYAPNMGTEAGYMGNVGVTTPNNMGMNTMDYMQAPSTCSSCQLGQMQSGFMQQGYVQPGCNQVVQQQCTVDLPYYVNYNTHVVNNVIRRHIQIPVYSQTQETVYIDEWQTGCGCGCNR